MRLKKLPFLHSIRTHVIYTIADLRLSVQPHFVMACVTLSQLDVRLHSKCFLRTGSVIEVLFAQAVCCEFR